MEIRRMKLSELTPADYNPRVELQPGDPDYEALAGSLENFGYVEPIIWNQRTGNIVGGHQRRNVMMAQGIDEEDGTLSRPVSACDCYCAAWYIPVSASWRT